MKKGRIISIIIILLLVAAGVWYFGFRKKENKVTLITEKPQYGYIAISVTAVGTIQPVDTVAVGTQVSGTIKRVYVDFNSIVKKGQLLAELDKSLLTAQVQQFTANLQQSQSNFTYQAENFKRQSDLYKAGAISKADYSTAEYQYNSARDNVNSVSAQLRAAEKNLSFADIFSPIDGTVLSRNVSEGQTVASSFSTPTLFSIAKDLTKMQVRASVDEADIGNVKKGERVSFTVDAFPSDVFNGTVEEIRLQPTVSANVVTYTTIIAAPNEDLKLKPGMTANITIYTTEEPNALLIPATATKFTPDTNVRQQFKIFERNRATKGGGKMVASGPAGSVRKNKQDSLITKDSTAYYQTTFVWIKDGDSLLQKKISIGLNDNIHIQVIRGLKTDDEIVTGISTAQQIAPATTTERSPFMPQRRGGTTTRPSSGTSGRPN